MTFKGSVVVKRTYLLNMIGNMKRMMRSQSSDNAKRVVWGQQIGYERILEKDISDYDWDEMIKHMWDRPWTSGAKPSEMFEWMESSELS